MKYTGLTYRPPFEARSLLLQVTAGCSHNRCAFCTMYREVPFAAETMEQIEKDLRGIPAARSTTICSPEHSGRVPSANIWKRKNGSYPFWIWKAVITLACIRPIWCRCMDT